MAAESFVLPAGKPLEIAVTVERSGGFDEEIEITAQGLPEGVTAAPVKSLGKGDTAKQVKLALTASGGPHAIGLRIVGTGGGKSSRSPGNPSVARLWRALKTCG